MTVKKKLFFASLACATIFATGCGKEGSGIPADKARDFANALYNRQLYQQSVAEYERYLNSYRLSESEQANISFIIANIYFERVKDYNNALAYYLRIKELYPSSALVGDADKRIVECLERLQRSADAQQALQEATFLDASQTPKQRPGEVIAKIGTREITTGDLDYEMKQLPPYMLSQIKDKTKKIDFLKQYIASELLYDTAKRKGLDNAPEIVEGTFQAKKNLMVQKLLQDELSQNADFQEDDLQNYYRANISRYVDPNDSTKSRQPKSFDAARPQVIQDYIRSKQQGAYERMIERLMRAEAVEIYDDKIQ